MSRAYTKEEMREMFISHANQLADYWSRVESETDRGKLDGLLHSLFVMFDGCSGGFPCAIDLIMRPNSDDKQFNIDQDENYVEDGMVINDDLMLHEVMYK